VGEQLLGVVLLGWFCWVVLGRGRGDLGEHVLVMEPYAYVHGLSNCAILLASMLAKFLVALAIRPANVPASHELARKKLVVLLYY